MAKTMELKVDLSELEEIDRFLMTYVKKHRWKIKNAMDSSGEKARLALGKQLRNKFDQPLKPRVLNSPFATKVHTKYLNTEIGIKGGGSKNFFLDKEGGEYGSPAWSLIANIRGGGRQQKKSEKRIGRKIRALGGKYLVPSGFKPTPRFFNKYGNVSGPTTTKILSRIAAFNEAGFNANRSQSGKSILKRTKEDYFLANVGATGYSTGLSSHGDWGIHARVGQRPKGNPDGIGRPMVAGLPRGYATVFYVTEQPRYNALFPVPTIVWSTYERYFWRYWQDEVKKLRS